MSVKWASGKEKQVRGKDENGNGGKKLFLFCRTQRRQRFCCDHLDLREETGPAEAP